jgi:hypothetical protein
MNFFKLLLLATVSSALRFLHLTDIHLDRYYHTGAPNKCVSGTKLGTGCCRQFDIPLKNSEPCGEYGDWDNDSPPKLVDGIVQWVSEKIQPIDAIFMTGDDCSHHDVTQTVSGNLKNIKFTADTLRKYLPGVRIFNNVGNHDTYPIDQATPLIYPYMLKKIATIYNRTAPNGYYSEAFNENIQIISINSILYDSNNMFKIKNNKTDIQMKWLDEEFAKYQNKEIVLLTHIPVNGGESTPFYNENMIRILSKYKPPVLHLAGHTHVDRFFLYKQNNKKIGFTLIPNSIVPSHNFPGFRIYKYYNYNNIDYEQYSCDITRKYLECKKLYTFSEIYQLPTINLDNLFILHDRLKSNKTLLKKYCDYTNYPVKCTNAEMLQNSLSDIM